MLKKLLLSKKISDKRNALTDLIKKDEDFKKRSEELEAAIQESTTEEEQADLEKMVDDLEAEESEHTDAKKSLEEEIRALEKELEELEEKDEAPVPEPGAAPEERSERKEINTMIKRKLFNMDQARIDSMFQREDVKAFMTTIREHIQSKRAITNAGLTVPEVFLGLIRENIMEYSKLLKHVNLVSLNGKGRVVVAGTIPEAIWTECCATLNEMDLVFNEAELDCYKVGAYIPVCNGVLEDNDIDLADQVLVSIAVGIGLAVDKAILYGTGTKMPQGVVTRLAQTAKPDTYPATAREWEDLHESNIKSIAASQKGVALFAAIITGFGAAKGKYSRGEKVFVMNETTWTKLQAEGLSINAAGAIVTGMNDRMPVIGGIVEVLNFVPDDVIIGGYFDLYLFGQRREMVLAQSEHAMFVQDQTVFRGTMRADGLPVIAEGFVAIGINGVTPNATMTFAPDEANPGE